jgi:transposase-like protein
MAQDEFVRQFFEMVLPDNMADDLLVRSTAEAMRAKLKESREKGKTGWHTDARSLASLTVELTRLLDRPLTPENLVDIINVASMMRLRQLIYAPMDNVSTRASS